MESDIRKGRRDDWGLPGLLGMGGDESRPWGSGSEPEEIGEGALQLLEEPAVRRPRRYRVLLHNDDYTLREFVVVVLREVFRKDESEAVGLMRHAHRFGLALVGVFSREIAETKVEEAGRMAKAAEQPLLFTMEPDADDDGPASH